ILPGSDAAKAGIQEGDHIFAWNGEAFDDSALGKILKIGNQNLGIRRNGKELNLQVEYTGKNNPKKYKLSFAQATPPPWFEQWVKSKVN
ncbi:MAG: PDZ domain-containing protein, partial [Bacteroidia bacterium]|nr:PDZ domain-containing protein [Bacteroidia bacterium]